MSKLKKLKYYNRNAFIQLLCIDLKKIFIFLLLFGGIANGQEIIVKSDFPGGNILLSKVSQDTVHLKPDLSFTDGSWFHWYFKTSNITNKKVTFQFEQNNVFGKYGSAYSINNNNSWKWYGENRVSDNSFTYTFSKNDTIAYFSVSIPYTEKNLSDFFLELNNVELLSIETLCLSFENRVIEKVIISPSSSETKKKVIITARHHACETSASFVLEGIIESILNEKDLEYLRKNIEFLIIPFMDKDGVENGEQGKNRIPRDHNRDYDHISIHNSTATLRSTLPQWGEGKIAVAIDIHSPGINGADNEVLYMVGQANDIIVKNQIQFSKLLEQYSIGDMKYYHTNFLPFGVRWNTDKNYTKGLTFSKWAISLDGITMASTLEVPYANISGIPFSKDAAREFGKAIAYSLKDYLELVK